MAATNGNGPSTANQYISLFLSRFHGISCGVERSFDGIHPLAGRRNYLKLLLEAAVLKPRRVFFDRLGPTKSLMKLDV
jgi:hypothetical protein